MSIIAPMVSAKLAGIRGKQREISALVLHTKGMTMLITSRGFTQYYETFGRGIPLLCLPAFPFTHVMYREQQALADRARLLLPDYRGTGQSSFTAGPYTMDLLAGDMLALLDKLEIEQAVIVGVSMGMYVAFSLYDQHPERVRGLIMADTRADADDAAAAEGRLQTVAGLQAQGSTYLRERVATLLARSTREQRPEFVAALQSEVAQENADGLAEITHGLRLRADRHGLLAKIHVPTLVLCGAEDTVSHPASMREMANLIPGATFQVLPGAGHLSPWEQPELFNEYARKFLAQL
jgi:pimeloyl-ACP methyl ester carboxylesterase